MSKQTDITGAAAADEAGALNAPRSSGGRVLAYDRVAQNKRRTRLLLAVFAAISLPAAAFLAVYLTFFFVVMLGITFGVVTAGGALAGDNWTAWAGAILALAVLIALLTPVLIFWRAAYLVLRLSGARPLADADRPELRRTVENLCIGAGLPQPRLHLVESSAANAFSTGMSPESSSLVVTTGLLELLDRRELEGVLAHELVQIGNYDTRVSTILAAAVAFLRLPFTVVVAVFRFFFRVHWALGAFVFLYLGVPMLVSIPLGFAAGFSLLVEDPEQAAVVFITMSIPIYALVLAPAFAELLRAAVSRERQFLADADAVLLVREADPLAIALTKMAAAGNRGLNAARSSAHLWAVDPLADADWWDRLWPACQPPVSARVTLLAGMGAGIPPVVLEQAHALGEQFAKRGHGPTAAHAPESRDPLLALKTDDSDDASPPPPGAVAFRLTATTTPVFEQPDASSPVLEMLSAGALITVRNAAGPFLGVITQDERFGYIADGAPREPVPAPRLGAPLQSERGAVRLFPGILLVVLAAVLLLILELLGDNVPCINVDGC